MSAANLAAAAERLSNLLIAVNTLLGAATTVSAAIKRAQAENRDLTPDEMAAFARADDEATAALDNAIVLMRSHGA